MNSLTEFWKERFKIQASWTKQTRDFIFTKINIKKFKKILDIGCGTGEIALEIAQKYGVKVFGIDLKPDMIETCKRRFFYENHLNGEFTVADAKKIPYDNDFFDMTYCSFLLLWIDSPQLVINEMVRVTKPNGYVIALAEPDYGGKIDYPEFGLRELISDSLIKSGANPNIGRMLGMLFKNANLKFELGIESMPWDNEKCESAFVKEWNFLEKVTENWQNVKKMELDYIKKGIRFSFNPVFYVIGQKVKISA
jgi:ubiquinone/menaquinone biosynthesis C-methylase UbiE